MVSFFFRQYSFAQDREENAFIAPNAHGVYLQQKMVIATGLGLSLRP